MECPECGSLITDMKSSILSYGKILCSLGCYRWKEGKSKCIEEVL